MSGYVYRVVLWWLYVQTNAWEYRQETWGLVPVRRKNYLYVITCPADCQLLLTPAILDDSRLGTWLCLHLFVILNYLQASKLQVMAAPTLCNTTWQKCIAYTLNTWEQSLPLKPLFTLLWQRTFCVFCSHRRVRHLHHHHYHHSSLIPLLRECSSAVCSFCAVAAAVPPRPEDGTVPVVVLFAIESSCVTDCNFNFVRCLCNEPVR